MFYPICSKSCILSFFLDPNPRKCIVTHNHLKVVIMTSLPVWLSCRAHCMFARGHCCCSVFHR